MTELIIFDLDGTLLDTLDDLATAANYALRLKGFPEHELKEYRFFVGGGISRLIERALPPEVRDTATVFALRKLFLDYYQRHKTDFSKPYPGIPELLQELRRRDVALAVASNKYQQGTEELVRHFFGESLFTAVLGQREGVPVKPDPSIVHEILRQTGIPKGHTLYVGDSGVDMQTAGNSGLTSIGVSWGFRSRQELQGNGACFIVDRPEEILEKL